VIHPIPSSLGASLKADIERVKNAVREALKDAESLKPDVVLMVAAKRKLIALRCLGIMPAMHLATKCNDVITALEDKIIDLRRKPDEVCAKFASKHMRTQQDNPRDVRNRICLADAFEMLADALYR